MTSPSQDRLFGANSSLAIKAPVRLATASNITLSGNQTVDGATTATDDRILVMNQTDATENGIYIADSSTWERAPDFDGNRDVATGCLVAVTAGSAYANTIWRVSSSNPIVIDTSNITFVQALFNDSAVAAFIAAGTGAVQRTAQAKMRDIVSITDFMTSAQAADYLAGAHALDLTTAIQAALDTGVDGIYFPDGSGKITATINPSSDQYLWGPGEIYWTGGFNAITITTKTHVTVDGLRFQGNAGYYGVRAKTKAQFINVINCHAEECNLFSTNDISDTYSAQSESTYCNNCIAANNTGNIVTSVADTGFIVIAFSRDCTIVGNTSVGAFYGIFTWGGNNGIAFDAITNARKCIRVSIVANNVAPTDAGIFFLMSDSCVSSGNTISGCAGDVGLDMESCLACTHQNNRVNVTGKGIILYGLNRDCLFANNDVEVSGATSSMIVPSLAGPVVSPYEGMGVVAFRGNYFKCVGQIATSDFGLNNHLIVENNVFENSPIIGAQNGGNTAANILEFRGNTVLMDFTPTQANIVELGGGLTGFTKQSLTPTYIVENNKVINRTGVTINKVAYGIEAFAANGRIILSNNFDEKWGTSVLINTNVGVIPREVTVRGQNTNATNPMTYTDTTFATLLYDKWLTPTFAAGNFTAGGAQTWTVASGDVTTYEYRIDGKTMTVNFYISTSTVGGTPDPALKIAIPGGRIATKRVVVPALYNDNLGGWLVGSVEVTAGAAVINIYRTGFGTTNWSASTDQTFATGSITFEIN